MICFFIIFGVAYFKTTLYCNSKEYMIIYKELDYEKNKFYNNFINNDLHLAVTAKRRRGQNA